MIKERFFYLFLFFSLLIHTVLSVYLILDPLSGVFAKKPTRITQSVRISSIDFSALPGTNLTSAKKQDDPDLPLKKSVAIPTPQTKLKNKASKPVSQALPDPKKKLKNKTTKKHKSSPTNPLKNKKNQVLKNIQKKQSHALDKLSALESIEKIKQELAQQEESPPSLPEKNPQGEDSQNSEPALGFQTLQYFAGLKAHIKMYWNLPQELASQNLHTQVYAEINREGRILKTEIRKSSGNADFDARVLETINRADPFPAPPTKEIEKLLSKGVAFNFPK